MGFVRRLVYIIVLILITSSLINIPVKTTRVTITHLKGTKEVPKSAADCIEQKAGWPKARKSYGHRAIVVAQALSNGRDIVKGGSN